MKLNEKFKKKVFFLHYGNYVKIFCCETLWLLMDQERLVLALP